jgi:uncharacterized protein (DUF302 family)
VDDGIMTLPCGDDVDRVLRRSVAEIEARGLDISAVIDHNGDAADAGLDMPDSKLLVFGHANRRTPLMVAHPLLALDLPMKLLIWTQPDGSVFVSFNSAEFLAERHCLDANETDALRIVADIAAAVVSS